MFTIFAVNQCSYNMPQRRKRMRKVVNPPTVKGFTPFGLQHKEVNPKSVNLLIEEYEALRLCAYENYNHFDASVMMDVSRPTFTRIYASALQNIATAFVEGRPIDIDGGKVYFDSDWYECGECQCSFNNPEKNIVVTSCPLCGSEKFKRNDDTDLCKKVDSEPCDDICVCTYCHHEQSHMHGRPCKKNICSQCGNVMQRKK